MTPAELRSATLGLAVLTCLLAAQPAASQQPIRPAEASPARVTFKAGFGAYGTGDDINCPIAPMLMAGAEGRTGGPLFLALAADLYSTPALVCTLVLLMPHVDEDGWAEEWGGILFDLAPRLSLRAGHEILLARFRLEPSLGAGLVVSADLDTTSERHLHPWFGAALTVAGRGGRGFALQLEQGWNRVPIRHEFYEFSDPYPIQAGTQHLGRWRFQAQISLAYRL